MYRNQESIIQSSLFTVKEAEMTKKLKRNDPCPCGSNKKYKVCCWAKDHMPRKIKGAKVIQSGASLFNKIVGKKDEPSTDS